MKKGIIIFSVLFLTSCAKVFVPTQSDADKGAAKFSGLTLAQLNEGRTMFKQKCTECHLAKKATSKDEEQWRKIVPMMAQKSMKKKESKQITGPEQDMILKYLVTMSITHKK
jgi:uncharacterized membrane protein